MTPARGLLALAWSFFFCGQLRRRGGLYQRQNFMTSAIFRRHQRGAEFHGEDGIGRRADTGVDDELISLLIRRLAEFCAQAGAPGD